MSHDTPPVTEAKDSYLKEALGSIFNQFQQELSDVLPESELESRLTKAIDSIQLLDEKAYEGAYYSNYREEGSGDIPAFVRSQSMFYAPHEDEAIGTIYLKKNALLETDEAWAILLHELTHKLGPQDEVVNYAEPIRDEGFVHTTEIHSHLGPLAWTDRDLIILDSPDEPLFDGTLRSWQEVSSNFEPGEMRLWEAVTDWFSTSLLAQIKPGYTAKTGYIERQLIDTLITDSAMEQAVKQALFQGDKQAFITLLEERYGPNSYEQLRQLMLASTEIESQAEDLEEKYTLLKEEVFRPFLRYFQDPESGSRTEVNHTEQPHQPK